MTDTFRALCAELTLALEFELGLFQTGHSDLLDRARTALAQPDAKGEVGELSPKEVEAQEAFKQLRDEILNLSDGVEVNEVLGIIDSYTPEWV